jgi:hypothetical protein
LSFQLFVLFIGAAFAVPNAIGKKSYPDLPLFPADEQNEVLKK